jgi:aminopeptidase-like protein
MDSGFDMHRWATEMFPICRSLTGRGVEATLDYLAALVPALEKHRVPSGTQVLDWTVPDEWNIRDAYVAGTDGERLIDFRSHNLHVVGYSEPIDAVLTREELEPHLHSLPEQPQAIPYVTSYYRRAWGFCLTQEQREQLGPGPFRVVIDSTLEPGVLTYGEVVLPGQASEEVLLSTYICHPSMANNELSGPVVTTALLRWLASAPRRYTYRAVFLPETIGAITYLSKHLDHLRKHIVAGWVLTCIGDDRAWSYLPSRRGDTPADRVSMASLRDLEISYDAYSFLQRGSDERQWCSPGADLPVASLMRSKYGTYPEYHTSLDDLELVTPSGLEGGFDLMRHCVELLEDNRRWSTALPGEPQLSRRGLYPATSKKGSAEHVRDMMNVLAYCDGQHDIIDLALATAQSTTSVRSWIAKLRDAEVVREDNLC